MRSFALVSLFLALGATGGPATVTIQPSSVGFKDALAACPSGTLGAITLTLGHLRIAEAAGVVSDIDSGNPSSQSVTLAKGGSSATARVNASKKTVSATHVTAASNKRVACVAPD
jgi:hypothetical protein